MSELPIEIVQIFIDEAEDHLSRWESACVAIARGDRDEGIATLFRAAHSLKGSARSIGLESFGAVVHVIEDLIIQLRDGGVPYTDEAQCLLSDGQDFLAKWVVALRSDPLASLDASGISSRAHTLVPAGTARSSAQAGDIFFSTDDAETSKNLPTPVAPIVQMPSPEIPSPVAMPEASSRGAASARSQETVRVAAHKLEQLIQLVGELSVQQSIIEHHERQQLIDSPLSRKAIRASRKLTLELQNQSLSLRMQPVQMLFQRLERIVVDVARELGKKVCVTLTGTDVELDKSVLEKVTDPLAHIVRNAVDHGLERPPGRLAAGKAEEGHIALAASLESGSVVITVEDDGFGLPREKILRKALEKGLVAPHARLTDDEITQLIFLPGFSTAEKVTNVSGRGVGMDVVRAAVNELTGRISVSSVEGKGTRFEIALPTSLSLMDVIIVDLEGNRYAVPFQNLEEIIDLSAHQVEKRSNGTRCFSLRGRVMPVLDLDDFIPNAGPPRARQLSREAETEARAPALVVRVGKDVLALGVTAILGQQRIVVRPLAPQLKDVRGLSGTVILGDGEPGLIVDLGEIANTYFDHVKSKGAAA